jgi:hypothetical protein
MEPQKRARYSKFLDAEELEEIMMEQESDEEFTEPTEGRRGYRYKGERTSLSVIFSLSRNRYKNPLLSKRQLRHCDVR